MISERFPMQVKEKIWRSDPQVKQPKISFRKSVEMTSFLPDGGLDFTGENRQALALLRREKNFFAQHSVQ